MRDPVLATKVFKEDGVKYRMKVLGGLHMIKGNHAPNFTIRADVDRWAANKWVEDSGGTQYDQIRKHFGDRFDDMIALHLSDISGLPMHSVANGWYWLAGAVPGNFGERYHGGNRKIQHWKADGEFDGYRESTPEECLKILSEHLRISLDEAKKLAEIRVEKIDEELFVGKTVDEIHALEAEAKKEAKGRFAAFVTEQIEKHGLKVFGDPWNQEEGLDG